MHPDVSEVGNVRTFIPTAPSCRFCSKQHPRPLGEFKQFLGHAPGSLVEMETQILIGERLGFLEPAKSKHRIERTAEVGKIIHRLLRSLSTSK